MKGKLKRLLSLVLVVTLFVGVIPAQALAAEENEAFLPQIEIGDDILDHDVFYLATAQASIEENSHTAYLLKVGRGGSADSESSVLIKIADMTAKYGEDYIVRVRDEKTKIDNPKDNESLMEKIEGSDFEQRAISDSDEIADKIDSDPEAQEAYREGVNAALEYLEDASGLKDKYGDDNPYADAVEEMNSGTDAGPLNVDIEAVSDGDEGAIPANGDGETLTIGGDAGMDYDPVQQAANMFTGQNATAQRLTSEGDMFQDLQAVANVMTNAVVGASVELTFAEGETEKYLEIVPKNNNKGDGDRMFYTILGAPSGTTTNSAASSCAFTIVDDEEQEPATVSFSDAVYRAEGESITVTVNRSGAMNTVVSAKVKTTGEGTAQVGRDYSQVDSELVFPFGVDHLTVDIPVRTDYLTGEGTFELVLEPTAGCEAGETANATVYLDGSYKGRASLMSAANDQTEQEDGDVELMAATVTDRNNLATHKTLDSIDISKAYNTHFYGSATSEAKNEYNNAGFWQSMWVGKNKNSSVSTWFLLSQDYWTGFFLSGAEVKWWRSYGCGKPAEIQVALVKKYDTNSNCDCSDGPYTSTRDFGNETRYMYPSKTDTYTYKGGSHPQMIAFDNCARCDDCSWLWISGITPILRPFQINVKNGDRLTYLLEDGTRGTHAGDTAANATIAEGGSQVVLFKDDSFTVETVTGTNVSQYTYMTALNLMNGAEGKEDEVLYTLGTNKDPAVSSITYTLNTANMEKMIKKIDPNYYSGTGNWNNLLRENPRATKTDGYATYAHYNVKPQFDYVGASVTLRNPYSFPVTMRISGTEYKLKAREVRKINTPDGREWHKGDTMAVSKIILSGDAADSYVPVGVRYESKFRTTDTLPNQGTLSFVAGNAVYVSGGIDGRLNYAEVIVEPNLQEKDNKIEVFVKTSELSQFITEDIKDADGKITQGAGLLGTKSRKDGDYTVFTYADTDKTINGKLYAITATPKEDNMVCVWEDNNTLKTYEGNTFYFTAGEMLSRNQIYLSLAPATASITLQGTLKYTSYNLRAGLSGIESNVPAAGAVLAAGSAGGTADKTGFISAGPIPCSGYRDRYVRYLVSVNGTDLVKEALLPTSEVSKDTPVLLWDFDQKETFKSKMGKNWENEIDYRGARSSEADNYFIFSARGSDPFVSIDTPVSDASLLKWVKIRYYNFSYYGNNGANKLELFASIGNAGKGIGNTNVQIPLETERRWCEVVYPITNSNWKGEVKWLRLDPMVDSTNSGTMCIDYVAFFEDEAAARAFRSNAPTVLYDFGDGWTSQLKSSRDVNITRKEYGEGMDSIVVTPTWSTPKLELNTPVTDQNKLRYVKFRARNVDKNRQFHIGITPSYQASYSNYEWLDKDDEGWHEYVMRLYGWYAPTDVINIYPSEASYRSGDSVEIDYIAFFEDEKSAKNYRHIEMPSLVWDFNSDNAMDSVMGGNREAGMSKTGEKDSEGNNYYTFTKNRSWDRCLISVETPVEHGVDARWLKVRARNLNGAPKMTLGMSTIGGEYVQSPYYNTDYADIELNQDDQWHEYVIDLIAAHKKTQNMAYGALWWQTYDRFYSFLLMPIYDYPDEWKEAKIQIDYMAFFPTEEAARAYNNCNSEPTELWDFNYGDQGAGTDRVMNSKMNYKDFENMYSYFGQKDSDGNSFYTFDSGNATLRYSNIRFDTPLAPRDVRWVKARVRTSSAIPAMALEPAKDSGHYSQTADFVQLHIEKNDGQWHDYVYDLQELGWNWKDTIPSMYFFPFYYSAKQSRIDVDYIAFFDNEAGAKGFRATPGGSSSGSGSESSGSSSESSSGSESSGSRETVITNTVVDISSNFPTGVSPVTSSIFKDIQIEGTMSDNAYQIEGSTIPVVQGQTANMTVKVRSQKYLYSMTGKDGNDFTIYEDDLMENPVSVQLVVYDQNDVYRGAYEPVDQFRLSQNYYTFDTPLEFTEPEELIVLLDKDNKPLYDKDGNPFYVETNDDGKPIYSKEGGATAFDSDGKPYYEETDESGKAANEDENGTPMYNAKGNPVPASPRFGLIPEPGDKLYLRLVTDRLAQTEKLRSKTDDIVNEYRYSDIFTGYTFRQPVSQAVPPKVGIDKPIEIEFGDLPLISNTGMDLGFPFVNIGIMRITKGYRIYFGVSPMQITDTVKGTHISSMSGAGGEYWKDLFSIKHPFDTFKNGVKQAKETIDMVKDAAKSSKEAGEKFSTSSLGAPSWKFDMSIGMYFDFTYAIVNQGGTEHAMYRFDGLGGYVSISLGFSMAWYIILPVVFLPAYFGIELGGTVMGFLGADFNSKVYIDYDSSMNGTASLTDGITSLNGGIRGSAYVQLCFGVGLCGTLGVRLTGRVNMIANWEPTDPHGSWGFYVSISAGVIIDLFLFSVPLVFEVAGWPFGSFDYYSDPDKWKEVYNPPTLASANSTFRLREGSGEDSTWLGDSFELMGAFAPNRDKQKELAKNAYERPDSQLITLSDGETVALAFIDSDKDKGEAQRTTLKMATYANGSWSDAVTVSNDETGDFQPSIAETKDGKILAAWVSPSNDSNVDLSTDEGVMEYLNSMEVYSAFIELDDNKQIKTKTENGVTVADTEVTRITNDHYTHTADGVTTVSSYYDSNPTVVCDMESGDAMVYYIKSGRSALGDGKITDYINPYTNDCVVCYMPYNAEEDTDKGRTVPAGWLTDNFYYSELHGDTANENMLITNFGGQRFLDGAVNANNERYAIPDFTAVAYNGLAIYAYTVDTDGKNDTDSDKEIYLQVYDFRTHETRYRIALTDDSVADTMPQFFRSKVNAEDGMSTEDENTHTKLFWYRNGKEVVYIDITTLLREGINADGTLKTETNGGEPETEYTYELDGKTHYRYTDPRTVWYRNDTDSHASLSQPDFKAVEDSEGNLYVLWTEGVTDEDGNTAQEIFGSGLVDYETTATNEDGNTETTRASSGWSKPYQITRDGYNNDEIAVAMSGENLMVVHNRFKEELVVPDEDTATQGDESTYSGETDEMPLIISDMCLVADTLEPCGSVETESITVNTVETVTYTDEEGNETETEQLTPVTLPEGGEKVAVEVTVANNGMNIAKGYKLSLYAGDKLVGEKIVSDHLIPNGSVTHTFEYTMPANVDGLVFKAVAQEMRDDSGNNYYNDTDTYLSDPITAQASYELSGGETYQDADGFHAKFTVTNTGNAASGADDTLNIQIWGPANLANLYPDEQGSLYSEKISLGIGESKEFDVPAGITPEMIKDYGYVTTRAAVEKKVVEQVVNGHEYKGTHYLSNLEYVYFELEQPMNMTLDDVSVEENSTAGISFSMDLGDSFRDGDSVTYAMEDSSIARLQDGKVLGVSEGTTTLYATHAATGATVSSTVTVTPDSTPDKPEATDKPRTSGGSGGSGGKTNTANISSGEGSISVNTRVSGNTAAVTAPTKAQLEKIIGQSGETGSVTVDLSTLPETVTAVSIPADTVKAIGEAMADNGGGLTVKLPNSTVNFDAQALASIAEQTDGKDLKLNVDLITESELGDKQKETVAELNVQEVYDIYLTVNNKRITDLGGGKATVEISRNAEEGGQQDGIAVWYLDDEGGKTKIQATASADAVTFVVTELSKYVLAYDETLTGDCDRGDDCPMTGFSDLNKSLWYHDGVHWALENGVMQGVDDGKFAPDTTTSRAMIVAMLHRMDGEPTADRDMDFADVEDGKWYTEAIRWAASNGIVAGYENGKFGPEDDITREQLAAILYRYAKTKGHPFMDMRTLPLTYDDASDVSDWAYESMCWMTMQGVIQGMDNNKLSPKTGATRAQVANMLMRYDAIER